MNHTRCYAGHVEDPQTYKIQKKKEKETYKIQSLPSSSL